MAKILFFLDTTRAFLIENYSHVQSLIIMVSHATKFGRRDRMIILVIPHAYMKEL